MKTPKGRKLFLFQSTSSCLKANSKHLQPTKTTTCQCPQLDKNKSDHKVNSRSEARFLKATPVMLMIFQAKMLAGRRKSSSQSKTISCQKEGSKAKVCTMVTTWMAGISREAKHSGQRTSCKSVASSKAHPTTQMNTVKRKVSEPNATHFQ